MPARGQGTLVALGLPLAALLAVVLWLDQQGAGLDSGVAAAVVLVSLTALAQQVSLVAAPRTSVSPAAAFLVAAALLGGPLLGVLAGAATQAFTVGDVWRKRSAYAGAGALQGFVVGVVAERLTHSGVGGAVVVAAVGLLTGLAVSAASVVLVARDRDVALRPELVVAWRAVLCEWFLPAPLLVAVLYLFEATQALALTLAAGLLLAVAVANRFRLRLERSLAEERSRARVDALTSAPNRYALAEALTAEQARIRRGGRTAALCFLDLDRFKTVNDSYGYAAGDALLVDVYQRLRGALRASDLVFRWGGEEFVVLAPHVESTELADFAERLRLLLATRPFSIDGRPRTITGSVGAVLLDEARPSEAALEIAGRLVRKAKLTRNTAVVDRPEAGAAGLSQAAGA
ncbi:MAG TPA: GGDEF domain-containing protein [Gaiellaceae bacterium]|nr:GGDEF domain-containing protein [Gaiellaceae bacterium]